jgi:phosphate transport system permease protein
MTVLMATGNAAALPGGFFDSVRTMAATIAIELGEAPYGTPHYHGLFAVGGVLFLMTLSFNLLAERIAARFRYQA